MESFSKLNLGFTSFPARYSFAHWTSLLLVCNPALGEHGRKEPRYYSTNVERSQQLAKPLTREQYPTCLLNSLSIHVHHCWTQNGHSLPHQPYEMISPSVGTPKQSKSNLRRLMIEKAFGQKEILNRRMELLLVTRRL